jgi:hypothetical protein
VNDVVQLLTLPPTEQICGRLLSGDPDANGVLDDLNGNGVADLQELLTGIFGAAGGGTGGGVPLPGLPAVGR